VTILSGIKCIVFDIDDTLYLERDYVQSGFRAVGEWLKEHMGLETFADPAWVAFESGVRGRIFDEVLRDSGIRPTPSIVASLVEVYREHDPAIELLSDARECLNESRGRAFLGVISDGPVVCQRAKVRALGLSRWIDQIILTEGLGSTYAKPHPRAFEVIQQAAGAMGNECLYVADNPAKDFQAPAALGWMTYRVRRSGGLHADIASSSAVATEAPDLAPLTRQEAFSIQ
jgi:putative hydrolase of the HAD superfamily